MCEHEDSGEKVYLAPVRDSTNTVEQRRYCVRCGLVREDGAKDLAFFVNRLHDLDETLQLAGRHMGVCHLTQVEKRLILRSMQAEPVFADVYGTTFAMQYNMFKRIVSRYRDIPECVYFDALN